MTGTPLLLDRRTDGAPGDLAVVRKGRGRARVERVLGPASSIEVVLEGLLVEEGELRGFEPYDAPAIDTTGRVDLRDRLAFTIDPDTAKDFDDALTVEEDRAFVHIADVSWFVQAGTPLDRGAAERAFSVYVPGLVSPMLPPELSEELCSLRPNVDRLCVTVEFPLDGGGRRCLARVGGLLGGCRTRKGGGGAHNKGEAPQARDKAHDGLRTAIRGAGRAALRLHVLQ